MAGPWADGSELNDAVIDWCGRTDLVGQVSTFRRLAEIKLQRRMRLRFTQAKATGTLTADSELLALPDDFISSRYLWIDTTPRRRVELVSPAFWLRQQQAGVDGPGEPAYAMHEGLYLKLTPTPGDAFTYELGYLQGIPALTDDGSNWLLENGPDVLLHAMLVEVAIYLKDPVMLGEHQQLLGPAADELARLEWRARSGPGPLQMRAPGPTP